ncbi:ferredoxin Fer [Natronoarchaeum rubrum]|uniref:ferredoxin Fer n=1 Tax=Natronoarchaeum rubrum TaxID=755311 RepID=UPI0021124747|nr:ferredoxin Fer [Natronoarchaeum rubrum]HMB50830.1 ferredoxin Fer [Natronoarchaeum rubrum]
MASPYEILGVDPDASEDELVDAYRQRVKEAHPDQGGSAQEFQTVKTAYERIQNGDGRADLDAESADAEPSVDAEPEPPEHRVEYLNYEVLDDHGWSIDDDDLFEKAEAADLTRSDHGEITVDPGESLLEAAENSGRAWPFACRGGACSNCAVAVIEGEIPPPTSHVLTQEMLDRGIRLSCITSPITTDTKVVYNVKHLPEVEELLLSASRFERAHTD